MTITNLWLLRQDLLFMVWIKKQLTRLCFRLAGCSKACFLFGHFSGWILSHLGVVSEGCGAPVTGWFPHLRSQGDMVGFRRPYKILQSRDMNLIAAPESLGSFFRGGTLKCSMKTSPTTTFVLF